MRATSSSMGDWVSVMGLPARRAPWAGGRADCRDHAGVITGVLAFPARAAADLEPGTARGGRDGGVTVAAVFGVEADYRAGRIVLGVRGALDLATAPAFRQAVVRALAEVAPGDALEDVAVDLTACDHIDSVGVGLLLGVRKRALGAGASVVVVCDEPRIRRVLDLTGVDQLIPVVERLLTATDAAAVTDTGTGGE